MNRLIKYIRCAAALWLAAAALAGCNEGLIDPPSEKVPEVVYNPDGTLRVTLRMEIPGISDASTRVLDDAPDYAHLDLYLLVFEEEDGLKQYARPTLVHPNPDELHGNHTDLMTFDLSLEPTEKPAIIHLVATNQSDFEKQIIYGTEERVITSLYTSGGSEAYWQRRAFEFNIPSREQAVPGEKDYDREAEAHAQAITDALKHVPMIRNFCRVSVDNRAAGFTLTGVYVFNTVDRGSVAPYVTASRKFVDYYDEPAAGGKYSGKSYARISEQGHIGTLPAGVVLINKPGGEIQTKREDPSGGPLEPVYFYERPARTTSTERTYVLLRGRVTGAQKDSYYKLDLGYIDEDFKDENNGDAVVGRFAYYDLLRNFDYTIRLKSVENQGYESPEEAASGAVFNNFSAAVEARNMTSISDGDDMIFVKFRSPDRPEEDILFTSYVFTQPAEKVDLWAQYRTQINNNDGGTVHNELIHYKFDPSEGDAGVIASIVENRDNTSTKDSWNKYTVTGGTPTETLRQQTMYIYRGNKAEAGQPAEYGLYRVITFFSHLPWSFVNMDTFPGLWESITDMPSWEWSQSRREIGQSKGSPLTLFFELPGGLPQAIFPLEFVIESDRQNIQNAYQGNAVVRSVRSSESLFYDDPTIAKPTTTRIQYVKTVTWEDYFGENRDELVGTGSSIVRCRFVTITDLAQDGIGGTGSSGESVTTLRVSNPYFGKLENGKWKDYSDTFERKTSTSDPSPRSWDFNSAYWDQIMFDMNQSRTGTYSASADELDLNEGARGSMSNDREGADKDGVRYVRLSNTNDALSHTHTYPASQARIIRLEVISADDAGTPAAPRIAFSSVSGGTLTAPSEPKKTEDAGDGKTIYIYEIDVPESITELTLDVKAPAAPLKPLRVYKIDFYPRWDEYDVKEDAGGDAPGGD